MKFTTPKLSLRFLTALFALSALLSTISAQNPENNSTEPKEPPPKPPPAYSKIPDHIESLVQLEDSLREKLYKLLSKIKLGNGKLHPNCRNSLATYFEEYKVDNEVVEGMPGNVPKATAVTENPLLAFRMMRRMVDGLLGAVVESCETEHKLLIELIDEEFTSRAIPKPVAKDLHDAQIGLLILQFVYTLNATSHISRGILNGVDTKVTLSYGDCIAMAAKSIETRRYAFAYQWMVAAQQIVQSEPSMISKEDLDDLREHWKQLLEVRNKTSLEDLHKDLNGEIHQHIFARMVSYPEYAPCRGQSLMSLKEQAALTCNYEQFSDPYFFINPLKTELISEDPMIIQFYDFATNRDVEHIRGAGSIPTEDGIMRDQVVRNLNRRIEMVTGLGVTRQQEHLQRALYTPLGTFCQLEKLRGEFDAYDDEFEKKRLASFMIHLNDVTMGGNTIFLNAKTFAEPIKGSALLWYNWGLNGKHDERVKQESCPCLLGYKQTVNRPIGMPPGMILQCSKSAAPTTA